MNRRITFRVEPVHVAMFSRAIAISGAPPAHRDDGELVAPPTFTESLQNFIPDYKWRPAPGADWAGSGKNPSGAAGSEPGPTVLHAEQRFEYFAPIRMGATLTAVTTDGASWEKTNRKGQTLQFREIVTEFTNEEGALVVRSVAVEVELPQSEGAE